VNVERLNALSVDALYALAEKMGLDLPEELERVFIVEALLEAFDDDNADRRSSGDMALHIEEKKFSGSELDEIEASLEAAPCIERRYNETLIYCMPRDPEWAFCFWDVKDDEIDALNTLEGYRGLFLRVTKSPHAQDAKSSSSFEIPVDERDDHWYIHMPDQDAFYRLELCARTGSKSRVIAHSNIIRTPRSLMEQELQDLSESAASLAALSGLDKLKISRVPDRHPSRITGGFEE
jgi:uncharacterized protein